MTTFFVIMGGVLFLIACHLVVEYFDEIEKKKDKERDFALSINNSFSNVKKYCGKFSASLDHIKTILNAFEELTNDGSLKYLKAFEGYCIPTKQFHFNENFYILVDEDLSYKMIITSDTINIKDEFHDVDENISAENVKKYLPYAKTLEEFREFANECENLYSEASRERERRNHINNVIKRNVK